MIKSIPDFSVKRKIVRHKVEKAVLAMSLKRLQSLEKRLRKNEIKRFREQHSVCKASHVAQERWSRAWGQWWAVCRLVKSKKGGAA